MEHLCLIYQVSLKSYTALWKSLLPLSYLNWLFSSLYFSCSISNRDCFLFLSAPLSTWSQSIISSESISLSGCETLPCFTLYHRLHFILLWGLMTFLFTRIQCHLKIHPTLCSPSSMVPLFPVTSPPTPSQSFHWWPQPALWDHDTLQDSEILVSSITLF